MSFVLVTGGGGYVGSHTCKTLARAGFTPVSLDDLSNGHEWAVKWGPLEKASLHQRDRIEAIIRHYRPIGVLHFAGFIEVAESVRDPARFWETNVLGTLNLVRGLQSAGPCPIVYSSTCAIFGETHENLGEAAPRCAISPYAKTKAAVEDILADIDSAQGLPHTCLRYFNAAGADPDGELGEAHDPETHLIPLACEAAVGARADISLFGTDYDTTDGTCVRDYVHVCDLAAAHVTALERLLAGGPSRAFNLGSGVGHSVKQVLAGVRRISGRTFAIREEDRRPGDCPRLVADNRRARQELGWRPALSALDDILRTAWSWHASRA